MTDHPLSNDINETPTPQTKLPISSPSETEQQFSVPAPMPEAPAEPIELAPQESSVIAETNDCAPFDEPAVSFEPPAAPFVPPAAPFVPPVASTGPSAAPIEPPVAPRQPAAAPFVPPVAPPAAQTPPTRPAPQYTPRPIPYATNSVPKQTPPAKKQPKKKHLGLKLAAIALVCALFGSAIGGTIVGCYFSFFRNEPVTQQRPSQYRPNSSSVSNTPLTTVPTTTLAQLYSNSVPSIVGVTNERVSYSYFGQPSTSTATGTGFIISEDGEILTNYHVVEGAQKLSVTMYDGTVFEAQLLGYEAESDVALLKINVEGLTPVVLGNSDALAVGEQIAAIGNPLGELTYTMTVGYVSAKGRAVYTDDKPINMMQIDAAINSGNSGGPLFNLAGEVVGITTAKYSGSSNGSASIEGIGFAIPINDVLFILDDLRQYGSVQNRAFIGVTITNSIAGGDIPEGALVQSVTKGSSGDKAGLRVSDIITAVGDKTVTSLDTLYQALRPYRAGDTVTMKVFRSGETIELSITFDAAPGESVEEPTEEPSYEFPWDYFFP